MKDLKKFSLAVFESTNKFGKVKNFTRNIKFRRSIFARTNIKKNEKITHENISVLRPKIGICASQYFKNYWKKIEKKCQGRRTHFKNQLL